MNTVKTLIFTIAVIACVSAAARAGSAAHAMQSVSEFVAAQDIRGCTHQSVFRQEQVRHYYDRAFDPDAYTIAAKYAYAMRETLDALETARETLARRERALAPIMERERRRKKAAIFDIAGPPADVREAMAELEGLRGQVSTLENRIVSLKVATQLRRDVLIGQIAASNADGLLSDLSITEIATIYHTFDNRMATCLSYETPRVLGRDPVHDREIVVAVQSLAGDIREAVAARAAMGDTSYVAWLGRFGNSYELYQGWIKQATPILAGVRGTQMEDAFEARLAELRAREAAGREQEKREREAAQARRRQEQERRARANAAALACDGAGGEPSAHNMLAAIQSTSNFLVLASMGLYVEDLEKYQCTEMSQRGLYHCSYFATFATDTQSSFLKFMAASTKRGGLAATRETGDFMCRNGNWFFYAHSG